MKELLIEGEGLNKQGGNVRIGRGVDSCRGHSLDWTFPERARRQKVQMD